jgi:uncharacterized C2H2 Zn-finger protein
MFGVEKVSKLIKCPICDDGDIRVIFIPASKKDNLTTTVGGRRFKSFSLTKERYEVENDCPNCGASTKKIEKALNSGEDYKKPSRESVLERMKKAGLSTRI